VPRFLPVVKRGRVEIGSIRPHERVCFWIKLNLVKQGWVPKGDPGGLDLPPACQNAFDGEILIELVPTKSLTSCFDLDFGERFLGCIA